MDRTPLHFASKHGYAKVVTLLLQAGANINMKIINSKPDIYEWDRAYIYPGDTALQLAQRNRNAEVVELIKEYLRREETTKSY